MLLMDSKFNNGKPMKSNLLQVHDKQTHGWWLETQERTTKSYMIKKDAIIIMFSLSQTHLT